jgi:hypothetical protein
MNRKLTVRQFIVAWAVLVLAVLAFSPANCAKTHALWITATVLSLLLASTKIR